MQSVAEVFSAWPSDAELGRDIGVPYPTISAWKQRGSIPPAYWREIIRAARRRGHPEITADVLVDLHARRSKRDLPSGFAEEGVVMRPAASPAARSAEIDVLPPPGEQGTGHFSRFKHLRRNHFSTLDEINDHIAALREEWDHR